MEKELLTREEVADLLRITKNTVDNLTKQGVLRARKIGRRVLFFKNEVIETVEACDKLA